MRSSTAITVFLLAVLASGSAAAPRIPGIVGADDRVIKDSDAYPWSAIGRLNFTTGGFCTATVIGPRRILTAAHCLWNKRTARWYPACGLHFLAAYRRSSFKVHALISDIKISPRFTAKQRRLDQDWAVLTLDRDVSAITGIIPLAKKQLGKTTPLLQAGYSRDRRHMLTIDRSCSVGAVTKSGIVVHDCDATFGDSGSPLMIREGDAYQVAAVHSAMRIGRGKTQGLAVSVSDARKWDETHPVVTPPGGVKACATSNLRDSLLARITTR